MQLTAAWRNIEMEVYVNADNRTIFCSFIKVIVRLYMDHLDVSIFYVSVGTALASANNIPHRPLDGIL